jgi:hypothetical protein
VHGDADVVDGGEEGVWLLAHVRHPRQYGGPTWVPVPPRPRPLPAAGR